MKTLLLPVLGYTALFFITGAIIGATAGYVIDKRREKRAKKIIKAKVY